MFLAEVLDQLCIVLLDLVEEVGLVEEVLEGEVGLLEEGVDGGDVGVAAESPEHGGRVWGPGCHGPGGRAGLGAGVGEGRGDRGWSMRPGSGGRGGVGRISFFEVGVKSMPPGRTVVVFVGLTLALLTTGRTGS